MAFSTAGTSSSTSGQVFPVQVTASGSSSGSSCFITAGTPPAL